MDEAPSRRGLLARYADTGIDRVMTLVRRAATDVGEVDRLLDDAAAAGCELVGVARRHGSEAA